MYAGSGPNGTKSSIFFKLTQWPSARGLESFRISTGLYGTWVSRLSIGDHRGKTSGYDTFDVTKWVKYHYANPTTEYGIFIETPTVDTAKINRACYISSDYSVNTGLRPLIYIDYKLRVLTLRHFYDAKFLENYGSAGVSMISNYAQVVSDYFLKRFNLDIASTVTPYTSPADQCTHEKLNGYCHRLLTSPPCDYEQNEYHCTNLIFLLHSKPQGVTTIAPTSKVMKWTGHPCCNQCTGPGNVKSQYLGMSIGDQSLMCMAHHKWEEYEAIFEQMVTVLLAHELAHTLGCEGDESVSCSNSNCVTGYTKDDVVAYQKLKNFDESAFCSECKSAIWNYIWDNWS